MSFSPPDSLSDEKPGHRIVVNIAVKRIIRIEFFVLKKLSNCVNIRPSAFQKSTVALSGHLQEIMREI